MKAWRRIIYCVWLIWGIFLIGNTNLTGVSATTNEITASDDADLPSLPAYEIPGKYFGNVPPDGVNLEEERVPLNLNVTTYLDELNRLQFPQEDLKIGAKTYSYAIQAPFRNAVLLEDDGTLSYSYGKDEHIPLNALYYYVSALDIKINFIDPEGKTIDENDQNVKFDKDGNLKIDSLDIPGDYEFDEANQTQPLVYTMGQTTSEYDVHVKLIKRTPYKVELIRSIVGSYSSDTVTKSEEKEIAYVNGGKGLKDYVDNFLTSKNPKADFVLDEKNISMKFNDEPENQIDMDQLNTIYLPALMSPDSIPLDGATLKITFNYEYYNDDPDNGGTLISYDAVIPSNLDQKITSSVSGKLGGHIKIPVPVIDNYTADKTEVSGIVNADGTITTEDQVKYTRKSINSGSSGSHSNSGNVVYSKENHKLGTVNEVQLYNKYGSKLNEKIEANVLLTSNQKMIKDNTVYYQVEDNKWVKENDVYIYESKNNLLRTYNSGYKRLYNSQNKLITDRGLGEGSDWFSDQIAQFNGKQYFRVATNEWVKADDIFTYQNNPTVISVPAQTNIFNEKNEVIGSVAINTELVTDRIALINGKNMYRVATDEYISVQDILK